jgi:hypothetical protein
MNRTLVIADLPLDTIDPRDAVTLNRTQMQRIVGGRKVLVDGGPATANVNDFDINNAIWEGRIKGPMLI